VSIYFGKSRDPLTKIDEASKVLDKSMTLYRQILALCYTSLCDIYHLYQLVLSDKVKLDLGSVTGNHTPESVQAEFKGALAGLVEWTTDHESNRDYVYYTALDQSQQGFHGHALSLLNKYLSTKPDERLWILRKDIMKTLGWEEWVEREERLQNIKFPKTFCKF
jgi:hypothetical protein